MYLCTIYEYSIYIYIYFVNGKIKIGVQAFGHLLFTAKVEWGIFLAAGIFLLWGRSLYSF